jgi:hypothetical protein
LRVTNKLGMRMSISEVVTVDIGEERGFGPGPYIIGAIILLAVAIAYFMKKKRIGLGGKGGSSE